MKRKLLRLSSVVALLVVFAVLAAACGSNEISAYSVNGKDVSQQSVDDELKALRDNTELKALLDRQGSSISENPYSVTTGLSASWLTHRIQDEFVTKALDERHAKVSGAAKRAAQRLAVQPFGSKAAFDAFPKSFRDNEIARYARLLALAESLNADITTQAGTNTLASEIVRVGRKAHVTVDPRYGTWNPRRLSVQAPLVPGARRAPAGATPSG